MISSLVLVKAESENVYVNQGIEKTLFDNVNDDTYILYLWTNDSAVVIGRNQNAYQEVDLDLLKNEGGLLARRLSGGGAVYHDKGNVNFTFIAKNNSFSLERNRRVILSALKKMGLDAYLTGRNDIEIDGYKISGNAYYKYQGTSFHHGTMLITSLKDKVARYLTPPSVKFSGKSVKSVKSRVSSLSEFKDVTKEDFEEKIKEAFEEEFNLKCEEISSKKIINSSTSFFINEDWILGKKKEYKYKIHFDENNIRYDISFDIKDDKISACEVYTDSLDVEDAERLYKRIYKENINGDDCVIKAIREGINV